MSFHAIKALSGGWAVRKGGGRRALKTGMSRFAAWKEARRRARGESSVAYLHGDDGRIAHRARFEA